MTINFKISDAIITDLLCTALEGGSNYWYMLGDIDKTHFIKGESLVDNLARSFITDKEYKLDVYDIESDEDDPELLGSVNYRDIEWALNEMALEYPKMYANIIAEQYDADDADVWFQLATMGEVVYG